MQRDAKAAHLKLDELIRALKGARNELIDLEKLSDKDLISLEEQFERVRQKAQLDGKDAIIKASTEHAASLTTGKRIFRHASETVIATPSG